MKTIKKKKKKKIQEKKENLLCKNCLISFYGISRISSCNIGKRKYDIKTDKRDARIDENSLRLMLLSESKKAKLLYWQDEYDVKTEKRKIF